MENEENTGALPKQEAEPQRKRLTPKRKKLLAILLILVLIAVALIVGLWGNAPVPYMTVTEAVENADSNMGKEIEIKGTVANWDSISKSFELTDKESNLTVTYISLPDGFNNNKEIVVKGILIGSNGLTLESTKIIVGCPSKY